MDKDVNVPPAAVQKTVMAARTDVRRLAVRQTRALTRRNATSVRKMF